MKKILITGGCGFVGRELVSIAQNQFEVHVVDNLHSGEHRLNEMSKFKFTFHKIDLRNLKETKNIIEIIKPDIIIHLAAIHFIPQCENEPDLACSTNISATINLLECIDKKTKFIFTSSAAVYSPSDQALDENNSKVGPVDIYGFTKLHGEDYVNLFTKRKNLNTLIIRLFNVIGPGETNPHILPEIISQLKNGNTILNLGNIESKRDFIDVRDVAEGFIRLIKINNPILSNSRIINLGSGNTYSMRDLLRDISNVSNIKFEIRQDPNKLRKVDNPIILASIKKLENILSWTPNYSISNTLKETWLSNEELPIFKK